MSSPENLIIEYNPDFWEVRLDQTDLEQIPNEASIWFEPGEEQESRYRWEDRIKNLTARIVTVFSDSLTEKQREAMFLYFCCRKTQREFLLPKNTAGNCRNHGHLPAGCQPAPLWHYPKRKTGGRRDPKNSQNLQRTGNRHPELNRNTPKKTGRSRLSVRFFCPSPPQGTCSFTQPASAGSPPAESPQQC